MELWGAFEGDDAARRINFDRAAARIFQWAARGCFVALLITLVWYGASASPVALAIAIGAGVLMVASSLAAFEHETALNFQIIAARARIIEHRTQTLHDSLAEILALLNKQKARNAEARRRADEY